MALPGKGLAAFFGRSWGSLPLTIGRVAAGTSCGHHADSANHKQNRNKLLEHTRHLHCFHPEGWLIVT